MNKDEARAQLNFDAMNEQDVREIIVRPLLHRLGYQHGTEANIRTEVTLRYDKAYLGHKNPKKDPKLEGRADYICDVISFGRWTLEIKSPVVKLSHDDVEQAHTYAAHPEVAAAYFMLTNGREFRLYQTGKLDAPALAWTYDKHEDHILPLLNAVGPDAIRKLSHLLKVDGDKPLGAGVASRVAIIGGVVTYEDHKSDHPLIAADMINGLQLPVTGGWVKRAEDGRLHGMVQMAKAAAMFGDFGDAMGISDSYDFFSATEYISTDPDNPTIFQNVKEMNTPVGKRVNLGLGTFILPIGTHILSYTEAVGYVENGIFKGSMRLEYDMRVLGLTPHVRQQFQPLLGHIPERANFHGAGRFEIEFGPARY